MHIGFQNLSSCENDERKTAELKKGWKMTDKNILIFHSSKNVHGRRDATGAFIPEARKFAKIHGVPDDQVIGVPCIGTSKAKRRQMVLDGLSKADAWADAVAFFCHGWATGIQFGFGLKQIPELAEMLYDSCFDNAKVILYCCSTAENKEKGNNRVISVGTDGGFADELRDEMARQGLADCQVDAHLTAGHTTRNPYVVRFLGESVEDKAQGATGGAYLVAPGSQYWRKWRNALWSKVPGLRDLRFEFPFMSELEVKQALENA
jgi:hypothetical protein